MDKIGTDAKKVLKRLGDFSSLLAGLDVKGDTEECFETPLDIMQHTMSFDVGVLYKVTNAVDNQLLLKIVKVFDPRGYRTDLVEGRKLQLDLSRPGGIYLNEIMAFKTRHVSCINVPGIGCDIMGFVYLPDSFGGGYLFGGDFCGKEAGVKDYEASVCEIMCNLLSTILIKTEFEHLAVYDNLTHLYNSRKIKEAVADVCHRFERKSGSAASLVLCDIDHFKRINDTFGHIQGDVVLRELGAFLSRAMREHFDLAGRYGGEEFLLVFDETDGPTAHAVVERIRAQLAETPFTRVDETGRAMTGETISITLSFGIAENRSGEGGCDVLEWISQADRALYHSKETGRNRTTLWENPNP